MQQPYAPDELDKVTDCRQLPLKSSTDLTDWRLRTTAPVATKNIWGTEISLDGYVSWALSAPGFKRWANFCMGECAPLVCGFVVEQVFDEFVLVGCYTKDGPYC
jgi:hypothetical protein